MISRRGILWGLLAVPAIIRTPGLLMPVRKVPVLEDWAQRIDWGAHPSMTVIQAVGHGEAGVRLPGYHTTIMNHGTHGITVWFPSGDILIATLAPGETRAFPTTA